MASQESIKFNSTVALALYYGTVLLYALGWLMPEGRLWGGNFFAFLPDSTAYTGFGLLLLAPLPVLLFKRLATDKVFNRPLFYWSISAVIIVLFGLAFYTFRETTHFMGDGYQVLKIMGGENPIIKRTEIGEIITHLWARDLFGGGEAGVLKAYQVISISSGLLFLAALSLCSRRLFEPGLDRLLFFLTASSGGLMLLFFGHVENYSLLALASGLTVLSGLMINAKLLSRGWIWLPFLVALFFHVMAITLLPAVLYLQARELPPVARALKNRKLLLIWLSGLILGGVVLFYYLAGQNLFFRLAFLPLVSDRFTIDGYTLFSANHLLDMLNFLWLMLPSGLLFAAFWFFNRKRMSQSPEFPLFLFFLLPTLGTVFLLDPKLGFMRDWDLFSFAAIPLIFFLAHHIVKHAERKHKILLVTLIVTLNLTALSARALIISDDSAAIRQVQTITESDPARNKNATQLLIEHFVKTNDSAAFAEEGKAWKRRYPEDALVKEGNRLLDEKHYAEGIIQYHLAIIANPRHMTAYNNLGEAFMRIGMYDSARFYAEIGNGLNPNNAILLHRLGAIYDLVDEPDRAEESWLQSASLDPGYGQPRRFLFKFYRERGDQERALKYLLEAAGCADVGLDILEPAIKHYLERSDFQQAKPLLTRAVELGLDSLTYEKMLRQYPAAAGPGASDTDF
ncbi:MAG: hypothetical protein P1R58_03145 [bacterium]|nr:hypothetical protein [bacterium]